MSFQRPSKDPSTWAGWTAHDHVEAAQRLWELSLLEFTGVHTVKVGGLLQEADVHLCRAKILLVQREAEVLSAPSPVLLEPTGPVMTKVAAELADASGTLSGPVICTCGADVNYTEGFCRNGHFQSWLMQRDRTDGEDQ